MEFILKEIEKALDCGLYYLALQSALTLPDICGALQSDNGEAKKHKYIAWYNSYATKTLPNTLSAEDCYWFRCSCVHQGSTRHTNSTYSRILFMIPTPALILCGYTVINDALHINIETFCRNMISDVRRWEVQMKENHNFNKNFKNFMKVYPNGLAPYIVGTPIIT